MSDHPTSKKRFCVAQDDIMGMFILDGEGEFSRLSPVVDDRARLQKLCDMLNRASVEPSVVHDRPLSASQRLHNICDALSEDADESPFTREEWDRVDKQTVELQKRVRRLEDAVTARRDESNLEWLERISQTRRDLGLTVKGSLEDRQSLPPCAGRDAERLQIYFKYANAISHPSLFYSSHEPLDAWRREIDEYEKERGAVTKSAPYDCIGCGEVEVPTQHTYCEECHQVHRRIADEKPASDPLRSAIVSEMVKQTTVIDTRNAHETSGDRT